MPDPSTFSIVAWDPGLPAWGVAVASKFLAAGAVVPWARAGAGAVATQSHANTSFGPDGLTLMKAGASAQEALSQLIAADPQSAKRQVGMVDPRGGSATFTGSECFDWAGGLTGPGFAVQGNILADSQVVQAMADAFVKDPEQSLPWRLHAALLAGDRAGGDRRGRQSASILVVKSQGGYGGYNDRWIDYRVDDHADPVVRLGEILKLHDLYFGESSPGDQLVLSGVPLQVLQRLMDRLGLYTGPAHGIYDPPTRRSLETFIGNENFEERADFVAGRLDRPVYEYLLDHFGVKE